MTPAEKSAVIHKAKEVLDNRKPDRVVDWEVAILYIWNTLMPLDAQLPMKDKE